MGSSSLATWSGSGVPSEREEFLELGRDTECGEPGEEVADWPVEVEQEVAGAADDGAQLDRGCRPHGVSWWLMVVQMLSNQARASSTYWDPIELSSSLMVWWNSTASLPIRS
jgi:hypothetical protein